MPLTDTQRRHMDIHIRWNTIYHWHAFGTDSTSGRGYIISCIERVMDSRVGCRRDLFLPNCFIDGCDNGNFFWKLAAIACDFKDMPLWHEMEFGPPLTREDIREQYVYTWMHKRDTYRFYTKVLNDGLYPELVWYFSKVSGEDEDIDSGEDTEEEEILLRVHP